MLASDLRQKETETAFILRASALSAHTKNSQWHCSNESQLPQYVQGRIKS